MILRRFTTKENAGSFSIIKMSDPQDITLFIPDLRPCQLVAYVTWLVSRDPGERVYDIRWPGVKPSPRNLDYLDANEILF